MDYKTYMERAEKAKAEANALRDRVASEGREFAAEERDAYERMRAEVDVCQNVANELRDAEMARLSEIVEGQRTERKLETPDANGFFRSMERGREYDIRTGWLTASGSGSNMVGEEWHAMVEKLRYERNFLRTAGARVIRTSSTHNIPVLSGLATAAITAENAAYTTSDPTVSSIELGAYKITLKTAVTEELLEDSLYDVAGELASATGIAFGQAEEKYFLTGSGSTQPTGIFNASAGKTYTASASITKDELIETVYALSREYRDGACWMMKDSTALYIAKLKLDVATSGTTPYFWTDAVGGEPPRLLGYPVYTNSNIAAIATGAKSICFGNPQYYAIGERGSFTAKRLQLNEYSDTFAFAHRVDGKPLTTSAFVVAAQA